MVVLNLPCEDVSAQEIHARAQKFIDAFVLAGRPVIGVVHYIHADAGHTQPHEYPGNPEHRGATDSEEHQNKGNPVQKRHKGSFEIKGEIGVGSATGSAEIIVYATVEIGCKLLVALGSL